MCNCDRLSLLLNTLSLSQHHLIPFVSIFFEELNNYLELSLDGAGKTLGLMTYGRKKDFAFRVASYMQTCDIDNGCLQLFLNRVQFFDYCKFFFKVEINLEGPKECSYYFRRRASLTVAKDWLVDVGVNVEGIQFLEACARALQKETIHFLGAADCIGGENLQKAYFSQPEDGGAWERIHKASQFVGLPENKWKLLERYRRLLNNKTLFFSISFAKQKLCPGIKLDIEGVEANTVETIMNEAGYCQQACEHTQLLLELFNKKKFDYLGLRLLPNQPLITKVYVYQSAAINKPSYDKRK